MRLALTLLCENPARQTGLTTVFRELIVRSLRDYPEVEWVVFTGKGHNLVPPHPRVIIDESLAANDQPRKRLFADHFLVSRAAKKAGADVLVTVGFTPALSVLPTVMHILTLHHLSKENQLSPLRQFYRNHVTQAGIRRSRLLITNSQFAAAQIRSSSSVDEAKLLLSPEGLDHELFQPNAVLDEVAELKAALNLDPGYLLWISNLYPYKQADKLLRAYADLPEDLRVAHPLVFVGGDWEGQRAVCLDLAGALGIADNLRFLGWVDEKWLAPLYRHASGHVLASREETWGRSVTEAMACGCPSVVNDIPVMHEVTAEQAIIVDFRDTPAATQALVRLIADDALRASLIQGGLKRASEFSFDRLTHERIDRILALPL